MVSEPHVHPLPIDVELLPSLFARVAREHSSRIAVEVPPGAGRPSRQRITYAELAGAARVIASRIRSLAPRDPPAPSEPIVAILLPRTSPLLHAAQIAAWFSGAAYTCIDPSFPDEPIRSVLDDVRPLALLTDTGGAERAHAGGFDARLLRLDESNLQNPSLVRVDEGLPATSTTAANALAYVIYTSGTTGRSKGVLIEHGGIANLIASDIAEFKLGVTDRVVQGSSSAYDSSVEETWLALSVGATVLVLDDETVRCGPDLVGWLRTERATVFCPPPTLLRAMGCRRPDLELPDLRLVYVGGEALPQDLSDLWAAGRRLENGYGPTECTVTVTRARMQPGVPVSIGHPVPGHQAWIVDEELVEVANGDAGELLIAGVGVARGYHERPELTRERFPIHSRLGRVYRTGDLARRRADGALESLGRVDSQVKIRGHRIELEAIEVHLSALDGVRSAACCADTQGATARLIGFVVPANPDSPPCVLELAARLRERLPAPMVPARIELVDALPSSVSGKLDRRALLARVATSEVSRRPPEDRSNDDDERRILAAFDTVLDPTIEASPDDDFFVELGGDSIAAALVVSELRGQAATAGVTVRRLYEARSASRLAQIARETRRAAPSTPPTGEAPAPPDAARAHWRSRQRRALRAGLAQALVIALGGSLAAALATWIAFVVLPILLAQLGVAGVLVAAAVLRPVFSVLFAPIAVAFAVAAKRALVGHYREGEIPVWSPLHVRHWIVVRVASLVPWGALQGTVFQAMALRALGARIGRDVHLGRGVDLVRGGWDLLDIEDGTCIARDAELRLVELRDGMLHVAPIHLGRDAFVDVRAGVSGGAALGARAELTALSWLPPGREIPADEIHDGVPATRSSAMRSDVEPVRESAPTRAEFAHGLALVLARTAWSLAIALPTVVVFAGLAALLDASASDILAWIFSARWSGVGTVILALAASSVLALLTSALALRLLGRVRPGTIPRLGLAHIRVVLKMEALERAGVTLSGTLFWPWWLRLAGLRIGRRSEISSIHDVVPELVEIGEETFFADGVYLGGPRVARGRVELRPTRLGRRSFVGNHAVIPAGLHLEDDFFLGVATVASASLDARAGAWFGHPPFALPRPPAAGSEFDRSVTHEPGALRFATRVFWETLRLFLPAVPLTLALVWIKTLTHLEPRVPASVYWTLLVPAVSLAVPALACLLVLALKWTLLGRVRPGQHPLWSCWASRWDFLYVAWGAWARPSLATLEGTPLLPWYLRAMGLSIGRGVVLGRGFAQVVDPDMLFFEDGATVAGLFQAHTFEDRVLKVGRLRVREGASLESGAVVFYGADIGRATRVLPHAVVMKNERLLDGRTYQGHPTA